MLKKLLGLIGRRLVVAAKDHPEVKKVILDAVKEEAREIVTEVVTATLKGRK